MASTLTPIPGHPGFFHNAETGKLLVMLPWADEEVSESHSVRYGPMTEQEHLEFQCGSFAHHQVRELGVKLKPLPYTPQRAMFLMTRRLDRKRGGALFAETRTAFFKTFWERALATHVTNLRDREAAHAMYRVSQRETHYRDDVEVERSRNIEIALAP